MGPPEKFVANLDDRIERLQEKGLDLIIEGPVRYLKQQWIGSQGAGTEAPEKFQVLTETVREKATEAKNELT